MLKRKMGGQVHGVERHMAAQPELIDLFLRRINNSCAWRDVKNEKVGERKAAPGPPWGSIPGRQLKAGLGRSLSQQCQVGKESSRLQVCFPMETEEAGREGGVMGAGTC